MCSYFNKAPTVIAFLAAVLTWPVMAVDADAPTRIQQINDDLAIAGQPNNSQIEEFAEAGGEVVINLRSPSETPDFNEAAEVTRAGMTYYNIPVQGVAGINLENAKLLDQVLKEVEGEKTLLHCSTANRVGGLMAARAAWLYDANTEEAMEIGRQHGLSTISDRVEQLLAAEQPAE